MGNGERIDRRATDSPGVHRTVATDGNGGKDDRLTVNVKTIRGIFGALTAIVIFLLTVSGAIWGGIRLGIGTEISDVVEAECEPGGEIDQHVRQISEEYMDEVQGVLQDDLDVFDEEQREQGKAIARIETKQTALEEKMDDDKEDLIREIRIAGGNG